MVLLFFYYYYHPCHPKMCSINFNIDHSEARPPPPKKENHGRNKNKIPLHKIAAPFCAYILLPACWAFFVYSSTLFAVFTPSFLFSSRTPTFFSKPQVASKLHPHPIAAWICHSPPFRQIVLFTYLLYEHVNHRQKRDKINEKRALLQPVCPGFAHSPKPRYCGMIQHLFSKKQPKYVLYSRHQLAFTFSKDTIYIQCI